MSDLLRVLSIFALVAANAFLVAGEHSLVSARRARLVPRAEGGSKGAQAALRLMDEPARVISTTQVGITAIAILTGLPVPGCPYSSTPCGIRAPSLW